jgi:hypothetical protein
MKARTVAARSVGNFVFSLTDHAANGFFNPFEWVPVVASAFAVGLLFVTLVTRVSRHFADLCSMILLFEAIVGIWSFFLHAKLNLAGPPRAFDNFIYGASPMARFYFQISWCSA